MRNKVLYTFGLLAWIFWYVSGAPRAEVTVVEGEIGPGALYGFYVPNDWNGDVVFFAHGGVDPNAPIELNPTGLKNMFVSKGYAFALSSYSENGYAVKRGVQETHQLRGLFRSRFGEPRRTYLLGVSMGAGVVIPLVEKYPDQYDGAAVFCGINGGTLHQMNRIFHFRVLFEYFYPDALPGDVLYLPAGTSSEDIMTVGYYALTMPDVAKELLGIDQIEVEITDPVNELGPAMIYSLRGFHTWALSFPGKVNGHSFFDNLDTEYSGSSDDGSLNSSVERLGPASPKAGNYMQHHFRPTGELSVPVITLHNSRDPLVPISHEQAYAGFVEKADNSEMLLQRTVDRFGHCAFTQDEWVGTFLVLVTWVETGVKPSP